MFTTDTMQAIAAAITADVDAELALNRATLPFGHPDADPSANVVQAVIHREATKREALADLMALVPQMQQTVRKAAAVREARANLRRSVPTRLRRIAIRYRHVALPVIPRPEVTL